MKPITAFLVFAFTAAGLAVRYRANPYLALVFFGIAVIIARSLKMANVWQKFNSRPRPDCRDESVTSAGIRFARCYRAS